MTMEWMTRQGMKACLIEHEPIPQTVECCGALAGSVVGDGAVVDSPAENPPRLWRQRVGCALRVGKP